MEKRLFQVIAVSATTGFVLGLISGFWPVLLASAGMALGLLLLARRIG